MKTNGRKGPKETSLCSAEQNAHFLIPLFLINNTFCKILRLFSPLYFLSKERVSATAVLSELFVVTLLPLAYSSGIAYLV